RLNQSSPALENLDKAIGLSDSLSEASAPLYYDRAVCKYRLRDLEGARQDYFHAAYLVPELLDSTYRVNSYPDLLGDAYLMLKLDRQPQTMDSLRLVGFQDRSSAFISSGNLMLAREACDEALRIDSTNSYNHTLRATILAMQGVYEEALLAVEKAQSYEKQVQPENNFYIKGLIYGALGKVNEGIENLSQALALNPENATYYAERASLHYQLFDSVPALADIGKAIELEPKQYDYYISRAEYQVFFQNFASAIPDCDTVLKYEPENIYALYFRGIAYGEVGKIELSLQDLEKVQEVLPDDIELKDLIAELRSALKEVD
ncbi:MAG: tetratricopeptide repeat protein, partial [Bacteroidota bacterium]